MWSEVRHSYRSCKGPFIIELLVVNRLDRKIKRYYFFFQIPKHHCAHEHHSKERVKHFSDTSCEQKGCSLLVRLKPTEIFSRDLTGKDCHCRPDCNHEASVSAVVTCAFHFLSLWYLVQERQLPQNIPGAPQLQSVCEKWFVPQSAWSTTD